MDLSVLHMPFPSPPFPCIMSQHWWQKEGHVYKGSLQLFPACLQESDHISMTARLINSALVSFQGRHHFFIPVLSTKHVHLVVCLIYAAYNQDNTCRHIAQCESKPLQRNILVDVWQGIDFLADGLWDIPRMFSFPLQDYPGTWQINEPLKFLLYTTISSSLQSCKLMKLVRLWCSCSALVISSRAWQRFVSLPLHSGTGAK